MLKRLEISEILLSKIGEIETKRFDSEYYLKKYLNIEQIINDKNNYFFRFSDFDIKVDASAFYPALEPYYNKGEMPFLRVSDVDTQIDYRNCIKIPVEICENRNFSTLNIVDKGDIVITKGGSIGRIGLIEEKAAVTRDLIFINSSKLNQVDYKFLFLYLLSSNSYDLFVRSSSMTAQPHLTIKLVRNHPIYNPSHSLKEAVVKVFEKSRDVKKQCENLYDRAEELLLQELKLFNYIPDSASINVKHLKESFLFSGRLDAEYYQKKYEDILQNIQSSIHDKLGNIVSISKSIEPGSAFYSDNQEGLPFMRVADYNRLGLTTPNKRLTQNFVVNNKDVIDKLKPKKNTILFSKDGSVGTAYLLRGDFEGITSGAILHLRVKDSKKVLPEYLTLVLNSMVVKMQAERDAGGSIILHWRVSEIKNVVVPIIGYEKQKEIAELVEESFKLKQQSEHLLEIAKRAVEIAIEENEEMAIEYINTNNI
jgi:restriction endonuclease S subunit